MLKTRNRTSMRKKRFKTTKTLAATSSKTDEKLLKLEKRRSPRT